jgi:hypothetical protein
MKNLKIFLSFTLLACVALQGASTSSSSSSTAIISSTPSRSSSKVKDRPSILMQIVKEAMSITRDGRNPGLCQIIIAYAYPDGTINTTSAVGRMGGYISDEFFKKCLKAGRGKHKIAQPLFSLGDRLTIAGLKPLWKNEKYNDMVADLSFDHVPDHYFEYNLAPSIAGFMVYLFNTRHADLPVSSFKGGKQPHLTYFLNPITKEFQLDCADSWPLGKLASPQDDPDYSIMDHLEDQDENLLVYQGDLTPEYPQEIPQLSIPHSDGSIFHIWVDDHDPVIGGEIIKYYIVHPTGPVPAWNPETVRARTVIKPAPKSEEPKK